MTLPKYGITGMKRNDKDPERIGIFGGSFNPVHKGHVAAADFFAAELRLDLLYVIPTFVSPLKSALSASGRDRLEMLKIAFSNREKVVVSDIELRREGTSYTCDTVKAIREKHPKSKLFYLIGDDWLEGFTRWRNYEYILKNVTLAVADRGGGDIKSKAEKFFEQTGSRAVLLGNSVTAVSSSEIRASVGKDLLPEGVYDYIRAKGLYEQ